MNKIKISCILLRIFQGLFILSVFLLIPEQEAKADDIRIVIDAGHGGKNLGADYNGFVEKDMTLVVALAMKEELEKYEGIEVFMTRSEDAELSLAERANYAKEVSADFLYCLHFNMSEYHTLFGSEVWISAFGEEYAKSYSFAEICLNELDSLGLYSRGIKTKLNKKGTDYYGVIKGCTNAGIPSCIIEHCHLDHENDAGNFETEEQLKALGVLDATAVAKYYQLKSDVLQVDYSDYPVSRIPVPSKTMAPDHTAPEIAECTLDEVNKEQGTITFTLTGSDSDSGLLYYDYSLDGGENYSDLQVWNQRENIAAELKAQVKDFTNSTLTVTCPVVYEQDLSLVCRIYNGVDLDRQTSPIQIGYLEDPESAQIASMEASAEQEEAEIRDEIPEHTLVLHDDETVKNQLFILILSITALASILIILILMRVMFYSKAKHHKKSRRKKHK